MELKDRIAAVRRAAGLTQAGGIQALAQPYCRASSHTWRISSQVASCRSRVWSQRARISFRLSMVTPLLVYTVMSS